MKKRRIKMDLVVLIVISFLIFFALFAFYFSNKERNSLSAHAKALACLFYSGFFIEQLTDVDFQRELSSNKQLASSSNEKKNEMRLEIRKRTIERGVLLRKILLYSFLWILSACCIALLILNLILNMETLSFLKIPTKFFTLFSIFLFAWATLGRLGWEGQSWGGATVFEQLDNFIFWILYWFGTLFAALAILISSQD